MWLRVTASEVTVWLKKLDSVILSRSIGVEAHRMENRVITSQAGGVCRIYLIVEELE
jgi:hypothetical protein